MPLYQGKQRVCPIITVNGAPVLANLTVTPSTISQSISPLANTDGYGTITVNAVTHTIDDNIISQNIKSGISILGVAGSLTELKGETRTVNLTSISGNTFTPSTGKNGITSITVTPNNQNITITPSTSTQIKNVPEGYSGYGTITCNPVTSSIDSNIKASNIKSGVSILGVNGSVVELKGQSKTVLVDSSTPTVFTITPDSSYNALTSVTIDLNYIEYRLSALNGEGHVDVIVPTGTYTITEDGEYDISTYEKVKVETQSSEMQQCLDDIVTTLTNLGITPPEDYSDLSNVINDSYNAILEELQEIVGDS